jgi:hypothetical protein
MEKPMRELWQSILVYSGHQWVPGAIVRATWPSGTVAEETDRHGLARLRVPEDVLVATIEVTALGYEPYTTHLVFGGEQHPPSKGFYLFIEPV